MEDFINQIQDPLIRNEVLRLWKLYPKLPVPTKLGDLIIWTDLQLDFCINKSICNTQQFLYYVDDQYSEELFYERLAQFK